MKAFLWRIGGMLSAPRTTLHTLARDGHGDVTDIVLVFVTVRLLIQAPFTARALWLASEAPSSSFRRITDALWSGLRTDVGVLLVAALVLTALAHLRARKDRARTLTLRHAFTVTAYAGVSLVVLQLAGAITSFAGFDAWWLPHHALGSPGALFVDGKLSMARFAAKIAIAYTIPLVTLVDFLLTWRRHDADSEGLVVKGRRVTVAASVFVALVLVLAALAGRHIVENRASIRPVLPGDVVPAFSLPRLLLPDGKLSQKRVTLDETRGKVVVLDFWASWCAPCRRSMPELDALATELGPQGLVVIGVNREPEAPTAAARTLQELGVRFPSVLDGRQAGGRVYGDMLGVTSLPTSFVIDRQGVLRHLHVGYAESAVLRRQLVDLLAESP
jgi:cytochrome c biogenesis protein CcmG/thiol:disulfide interchange protein DsbE